MKVLFHSVFLSIFYLSLFLVGLGACSGGASRSSRSTPPAVEAVTCEDEDLPENAYWLKDGSGEEEEDPSCEWSCKTGYVQSNDASDCVPEVPTVTRVTVSGLVDIGNSKKGTKNKNLTVVIEDNSKVSHYYLTHNSTFTPTNISNTEGGRSWSSSKPNSYTLLSGTIDGTYTLYLWVANVTETVVGSVASSDSFVLDTTVPSIPTLHATKPDAKDAADSVAFGQPSSTDASGGEVTFSYCLETPGGSVDCSANDAPFTAVNDWNSDLTLPTSTKGDYEITFKATDKLDHASTPSQSYAWESVACIYNSDSKSNPIDKDDTFSPGDKTRACTARDEWGDWTITCDSVSGYRINNGNTACITCGGGQYLQAGSDSCTGVTDNSGKYSPANNVNLLDCNGKPDDYSDWNYVASNQLSADCNWDCQTGYVKDGSTCRAPRQDSDGNNQYADADNNNDEKVCPSKPASATWVAAPLTGGLTKDQACDFTCPLNQIKTNSEDTRTCTPPGKGIYVVEGVSKDCGEAHASVSANSANGGGWATNQKGVANASDCRIDCGINHHPASTGVTTGSNAQCEQECSLDTVDAHFGNAPENSGRKTWDSDGGAWSALCKPTVCNAGYDAFDSDGNAIDVCTETIAGYWSAANSKDRRACTARNSDNKDKPNNDKSEWLVASDGLADSAGDCEWSCKTGYVKDGSTCRTPKQDSNGNNQYADTDNNNVERGCPAKPTESDWVTLTGGMTKDEACDFDCHDSHPNKDKANNACYANVADCEPNELPMGAATGTKDYTSAGKYGSCKVKICRAGYKKGLEGTVCFMPISLHNTVPLDNGKKGAPSDRRIRVRTGGGILLAHIKPQGDYYLTHKTPSQFTPRGDISSSEAREGGRKWFKGSGFSDFVEYTLPSTLANGEYRLYLWVADASQEAVSSQPLGESDPFTVDLVGPVITKVVGPSGDVPFGDGTVSFTLQGEDSGVGLKSLSYCKNPKTACFPRHFQGITSGVPFSLSYKRFGTQTITVKAVDKLDNERFQTFTWNMRKDLKCIANEVKTLAISNGREIKTCNENGQAWKSSNTVCDTGYTLRDNANGCHAKQIDCQDNNGVSTGEVKVLNTTDGSYGSCGVPPTVSIDRGNIPNISLSVFLSDDGLTLGGACSIDGGNVRVTLSINDFENFKAKATDSTSCTGSSWKKGIGITVPYLSGESEKTWKIEVIHSDADGRTATAVSTINRLCPDHYVLIPARGDYATQPFCVARYEMKQDGSNILPKYDTLPKVGVTRNEAIGFCQDPDGDDTPNDGYDLITNDEWQALARDIELVASNWSEGAVGSGDLSKGFSGGSLGVVGASLLVAEKDDNKACSGITDINGANPCSGTTWNTQRRTFTLSNGEVIWDLAGNAWEWVKDNNTALSNQARMNSAFSNDMNTYILENGASGSVSRNTKGHFGSHGSYTKDLVLKTYLSSQTGTVAGLLRGGAYHEQAGLFSVMFGLPIDQLPSVPSQSPEQNTSYHNTLGFRCVYRPPFSPSP